MGANDPTQVPPPVNDPSTPEPPNPTNTLVNPPPSTNPQIAALEKRIAQLEDSETTEKAEPITPLTDPTAQEVTTSAETDAEKLRRLENELEASRTVSQVPASGAAPGITDPAISLASIEPGIKWGIRNGLIDPQQFGEHIVKAYEDGEF